MCLRGGGFFQFSKICLHFSAVCLQFFKKTTASQTHFGFTNMGSEVLSFWVIGLRKGQFWFGSPCSWFDEIFIIFFVRVNCSFFVIVVGRYLDFFNLFKLNRLKFYGNLISQFDLVKSIDLVHNFTTVWYFVDCFPSEYDLLFMNVCLPIYQVIIDCLEKGFHIL